MTIKITHFLPSDAVGGAPKNVARLVSLIERRQDVFFWKKEVDDTDQVLSGQTLGKTFFTRLKSLIKFLNKTSRSRIICTHGRGMGLVVRPIALLFGFSVIHTFRGYRKERFQNYVTGQIKNRIVFMLEKILSKYSINIAVGSAEFLQVEKDLKPSRLFRIHNPVTVKYDANQSKPIRDVVFVGRRSYQKGFDKFMKIFPLTEGITFSWFGNGEDVDFSSNPIHYKSGDVLAADLNIYHEISKSKIFVSLSRWEGASTVVIEALMLGKPVIALSCQGVDEFIYATGAGRVVSESNLLDEIRNLLNDEALYKTLSANTVRINDIVDPKMIKKRYESIFNEI